MLPNTQWALFAALAFACGSIPFGLLVARAKGIDLRTVGSGNIGATNVGRALGRKFGIVVYFLDAAKGAAPVLVAGGAAGILGLPAHEMPAAQLWWWLAVAVCTVLGHMFSPFVGFKGGKGVATGSGALLAIYPLLTAPLLIAILLWGAWLAGTRMMSLASMIAALSIPVSVAVIALMSTGEGTPDGAHPLQHAMPAVIVTSAIALLVIWKHRGNIQRIRSGTEARIGAHKAGAAVAGEPQASKSRQ